MKEILTRLCETDGVTGFEGNASVLAKELLEPYCDSVEIDPFGSVIGKIACPNPNAKTISLDAHIDQIGFIVTEVLDDGFVRFAQVGGVDPRMLLGAEVTILADQPVYGVIACMPPHLMKAGEQDKAVPIHKMVIDTGFADAREHVAIGMPVVFAENVCALSKDSITGKCLDDRAGFLAILEAVKRLDKSRLAVNVLVQASCHEETDSLGAISVTFRERPEYGIAVDVSHAKTPDAPSDETFEYGGGALIGMGPNLHRGLTKMLMKTARAEEIDYQIEVMEGNTGTNAWDMQVVRTGVAMALISIPLKYMHTPIETIHMDDLQSVSDLIYHFVQNFDGEVGA